MNYAWFLYSNDVVTGPFTTEQVKEKIDLNMLDSKSFVWWKGQREWIALNLWQEQLPQLLDTGLGQKQKPIWYIDIENSPLGPLTQAELIQNLRGMTDLTEVRLWAVGMKKWCGFFEMHDVMEMLGFSRRENDRAPLMGTVAVSRGNEDPKGFVIKAASISVAGLGLAGAHALRRGDEISLLIRSGDLPSNIHARGEVAYVTDSGYAGVRFTLINSENQSLIHDYVKRFLTTAMGSEEAA
jgi:Tfp pilus assembly protein PilZ